MQPLNEFNCEKFEDRLENGIKLILFNRPNTPIYIRGILKAGSCFDVKGKEGLNHFLEHMLANGSSRFPTKDKLAEHIESVGGTYGLATSNELMWVNVEVADATDIDRAIDVLDAILVNPLISYEKIENERNVILSEIGRADAQPERIIYKTVLESAFVDSPFSHTPLGYKNTLAIIDHKDILLQKEKTLVVENITFIVSGDISIKLLKEKLDILIIPKQQVSKTEINLDTPTDGVTRHVTFNSEQTFMFIGFKGTDYFSKDALCLNILGSILTRSRIGRFYKKLRHEKGLVYNINWQRFGNIENCVVGITTNTNVTNVDILTEEIFNSLKELKKEGITKSELDIIKNITIKSLKRTMQTSQSWVEFHSYGEVFAPETYRSIDKYIDQISLLTTNDINDVIKKYIDLENNFLITVGKKKFD